MSLSTGLIVPCEPRSGGVQAIHLIGRDDLDSFTKVGDVYTAATTNLGAVFVPYEFELDTAEVRETGDGTSGSIIYTHEVELFIPKIKTIVREAIMQLVDETPCGMIAIVTLTDATKWVVGYSESNTTKRPLKLQTDTTLSGKALGDLNGSTVILASTDPEKMREYTGVIPV